MKKTFCFIALLYSVFLFSQEDIITDKVNDPKYREDQFYAGISYNFLENKPSGISQQGLSGGVHFGFIRDFPLNEQRNVALGVGLGYSSNSYNHNLFIKEENGIVNYQELDNDLVGFSKNKLNIHLIELPIQFRWRTSTMESYKFWRIYTGLKFGYVVNSIVKYKGELGNFKQYNTPDLKRINASLDLAFGWNTWNFYIAYGLSDLFTDDALLNSESIDVTEIKFGLMFYLF